MARGLISLVGLLLIVTHAASADTLRVMGAGSLTSAFTDLLNRFPAGTDLLAKPEFGPSGLMREKIEAGTDVDLFASADMEQARRLAAGHPERMVIHFTRNHLCAIARKDIGLTTANMLDRLLDPAVRLGTSTPGTDPSGDYAWAVMARADTVRPGARATLEAKALKLYGGGAATPLLWPGKGAVEGIFLANRADVVLTYCSGAATVLREAPGLATVVLPPELSVGPAYGMVLLNTKAVTLRFANYVMSETGQAVLKAHDFDPVGLVEPFAPLRGLMVQRAGKSSLLLSPERLAALPSITQRISVATSRGEEHSDWAGPLLWDVLVASGAIDTAQGGDSARLAVRVTGADGVTGTDGYTAVVALAEISPQFAGRQIQLAHHLNGAALPDGALRLVVPGDRRAGRAVRDVVRIGLD